MRPILIALLALALLTFEVPMARSDNLGFGMADPTPMEEQGRRPSARQDEPPKPRARPKDRDGMPAWEQEYWANRGGWSPEVEREWEEFERDPEGSMERMYREHFFKLQRQQDLNRLRKASEGASEVEL